MSVCSLVGHAFRGSVHARGHNRVWAESRSNRFIPWRRWPSACRTVPSCLVYHRLDWSLHTSYYSGLCHVILKWHVYRHVRIWHVTRCGFRFSSLVLLACEWTIRRRVQELTVKNTSLPSKQLAHISIHRDVTDGGNLEFSFLNVSFLKEKLDFSLWFFTTCFHD